MPKAPTIYDVAEHAGVSIATVSFTFTKPSRVASTTRDTVLASAEALGYLPSASARGLVSGRTGVLGFWTYDYVRHAEVTAAASADSAPSGASLFPPYDYYPLFIDEVQRGVQLESWASGRALLVRGGSAPTTDDELVTDIASRVDALVAFPQTVSAQILASLNRRVPVVTLGETSPGKEVTHYIRADNKQGMRDLVDHLVSAHTVRHAEFIGSGSIDLRLRFQAFQRRLRSHGLQAPREPIGGTGRVEAHQVAEHLAAHLRRESLPDAFVCGTDQHAFAVLRHLEEAGIGVPTDVIVTGFDGLLHTQLVHPTLTTVRQPMPEMGAAAVRLAIELMGQDRSDGQLRGSTLPVSLMLGRSCGC